jgi:hypothetical protein
MAETLSLTLAELLNIANDAYPDGFLANYFDPDTEKPKDRSGDTLAQFIVIELSERCFTPRRRLRSCRGDTRRKLGSPEPAARRSCLD